MSKATDIFQAVLDDIKASGLYKEERVITSPQNVEITTASAGKVLNFCANNYLGLANDPRLIRAATAALERRGFGLASVRFICGTQDLHKQLEEAVARFLGMPEAILYSSCFDANAGLFETLLGPDDAIISDALNHASIIDGVRLCKAQRFRYRHGDMNDLEDKLKQSRQQRIRLIATDGVFSMDGDLADLATITSLARRYDALVMVDDSHATGIVGDTGRGTPEACGVRDHVDIITSTFGKALGGGSGGFTAASAVVVELLRQRSRPYLFSNTLAPAICAASLEALNILSSSNEPLNRLRTNTAYFRQAMTDAGFELLPGEHPIIPIMLYDATLAQKMAAALLTEGIYVVGFSYPVVPQGAARIRVQISAAHERPHLDRAIEAFTHIGRHLGIIQ